MKALHKFKKIIGFKKSELEESVSEILESDEEGTEVNEEKEIIENLLEFRELRAHEVMVPRTEMVSVSHSMSLKEMAAKFIESGHTRIPIHRKDLDDVIGFIHVKDLLPYLVDSSKKFLFKDNMRDILHVPRSMKVGELLKKMRTTITHIAIVLDEYGGTDGVITIGDLIGEIVGDIQDEHDDNIEGSYITQDAEGYVVDCRTEIDLIEETLEASLSNERGEYETIGGFVLAHLGKIPQKKESFKHSSGLEFEVLELDEKKIKKLHIKKYEK